MAKNRMSKNIDNKLPNGEAGVKNLLLNVIIFVLLAIVIFLFYIFFAKLSGNNVEQKKNITKKFVPTEMIQVEVLNGCGVSGLADIFKDFLRKKNIDVVSSGNYTNFDVEQTIIIDRIGNKKKAEYVAGLLGVPKSRVITRINKDYFLDVSIVLGRDYLTLKPLR
jgi:hypothetical protein